MKERSVFGPDCEHFDNEWALLPGNRALNIKAGGGSVRNRRFCDEIYNPIGIQHIVMASRIIIISYFVFLVSQGFSAGVLFAQSPCARVLEIAEQEYQEGYFNEASSRLYACIDRKAFDADQEKAAYLLLGKIHYANLELEKARDSVRTLLMRDPDLELDPQANKPGFVDLVHEVMSEIQTREETSTMRSGFWFSLGIGPADGTIQCTCQQLASDDVWRGGGSGSFFMSGGGTVNPNLQLGAELNVWARSENNRSSSIGLLSFVARYYPKASGNFYLKGGAGIGSSRLEANPNRSNVSLTLESGGLGMQFGLGYDILLGQSRKFALSPSLTLSAVFAEEDTVLIDDNFFGGAGNPSFLQLGIGVTWL